MYTRHTMLGAENPFENKTKIFALMELYILDRNCFINSASFNKSICILFEQFKLARNRIHYLCTPGDFINYAFGHTGNVEA